jgi:uncharacterized coiled-coil protein SlyX
MNPFFKSMQSKKPRAVDPDAPPRPNLLSHDKTIREAQTTIEQLQEQNRQLQQRMSALESKMTAQTQYLQALHQSISSKKRS